MTVTSQVTVTLHNKKAAGWACGVRKSRYGRDGLYSPGNRRDSSNPGGDEAADHHERHGRVAAVGMYHNGGIITWSEN